MFCQDSLVCLQWNEGLVTLQFCYTENVEALAQDSYALFQWGEESVIVQWFWISCERKRTATMSFKCDRNSVICKLSCMLTSLCCHQLLY